MAVETVLCKPLSWPEISGYREIYRENFHLDRTTGFESSVSIGISADSDSS
jgi:hypothetical protein